MFGSGHDAFGLDEGYLASFATCILPSDFYPGHFHRQNFCSSITTKVLGTRGIYLFVLIYSCVDIVCQSFFLVQVMF